MDIMTYDLLPSNKTLFVFVGDYKDFCKYIVEQENVDFNPYEYSFDNGMGMCFFNEAFPNVYVWLEKYDLNTLAHEMFHVVVRLGQFLNVKIGYEQQEFFAYYIGNLVEHFHNTYTQTQDKNETDE